ncbi:MAG: dihydropteroate synthase [Nitrospirae bacterium]|nr:MAG: dihydropteroate synthase [Nitrospirota bacterium]
MPLPIVAKPPSQPGHLKAREYFLPLQRRVHLMGILNVTPDSFSDGGRFLAPDAAVAHVLDMVEAGADMIDIGAESTRPGAEPVDEPEEIRRLIPVVREVCRRITVPVSVDTSKASVARLALEAGAAIINDISALRNDSRMGTVVAESGAGLVLMHRQGTPLTMQQAPAYHDVVAEVRQFLADRVRTALECGISPAQIMLDPGIGFGKNLQHNLTLLARMSELVSLGYPVLVGVSRKAFIGQLLGRPIEQRVMGTAAASTMAILGGARVVRVHDVGEIRDVVTMVDAIRGMQPQTLSAYR